MDRSHAHVPNREDADAILEKDIYNVIKSDAAELGVFNKDLTKNARFKLVEVRTKTKTKTKNEPKNERIRNFRFSSFPNKQK